MNVRRAGIPPHIERSSPKQTWYDGAAGMAVLLVIAAGCAATATPNLAATGAQRRNFAAGTVETADSRDSVVPVVQLSSPVHDATVNGQVDLGTTASDEGDVTQVQWFVDDAQVGSDHEGPPWTIRWDTTAAVDGPHVVVTKARDTAGNWGTSVAVGMWVDNDAIANGVDTAVTSGPRASNVPTPKFSFESQHTDAVFTCELDLFVALPCSSPLTLPPLADGTHSLVVTAAAPSGQADPSPATVRFVVDTSPPAVELTGPMQGEEVSDVVALLASATDLSGVTAVRWYVDGVDVAYDGDGEPWSRPWPSDSVPDGRHRVFAKARDTAGNWGTSADVVVTVSNA